MKDIIGDSYAKYTNISIVKLALTNYRNYDYLSLDTENKPVVITGKNGVGKTNILESISLLSPGKGLRGAKIQNICKESAHNILPWTVFTKLSTNLGFVNCGMSCNFVNSTAKRINKIDNIIVKSQVQLANLATVIWLTPQMDGLFNNSSSDRRKFLDRLVGNFYPEHISTVYSYEYLLKERINILQNTNIKSYDNAWINIVEEKIAQKSVAIAASRNEAVEIINDIIENYSNSFPKANITIDGYVESLLNSINAVETEEDIKRKLYNNRENDLQIGRTNIGVHRSDLIVYNSEKNMPAISCSTGEQKSLLISIILAKIRAKALRDNIIPIVLFDDVIAHLDYVRREALFEELFNLNVQFWLTGTCKNSFETLQNHAKFFEIDNNQIL